VDIGAVSGKVLKSVKGRVIIDYPRESLMGRTAWFLGTCVKSPASRIVRTASIRTPSISKRVALGSLVGVRLEDQYIPMLSPFRRAELPL
jgi:hypothetical protein